MRSIPISKLLPGMVTAEDVYAYNSDQLILPRGLTLTDKTITKLEFYSIFSIRVEDGMFPVPTQQEARTYAHYVRKSPDFQRFHKKYLEEIHLIENSINHMVKENAPLDTDLLLASTLRLLENKGPHISAFDMLLSMRKYDSSTYTHGLNVALICNVFAKWLHFSFEDTEMATLCGLLHDIGKLMIPEEILKKPSSLSNREFEVIKTHPLLGYNKLRDCQADSRICDAALMHHEKFDGSGYPYGLKGDQISSYGAIVSIADIYDAMTSPRVYRGPLCPFQVVYLFESEGLLKYHPQYILTFLENVVNTYLLNTVRLSDGTLGEIIYINKNSLSRPTIKCGNRYINLAEQTDLYVEDIL